MKQILIIIFSIISITTFAQEKNKIVTLGSFHFHLVKSQFGIDFNINDKEKQIELSKIAEEIAKYNPTKIFVEWDFSKQKELDELYSLYLKDKTFELIKNKYGKNETMYFESELQQLGFKIANKLDHKKLYAFDYLLPEPNDTIMSSIQKNNQLELMNNIQQEFGEYGQKIITKFKTTKSLKNLLLFFNSKELDEQLNSGYISLFNKIGTTEDFSGAFFVSERYRRNLYMYSLIQKQIEKEDERILVIVGAQHSAGFKEFISSDRNIEQIELNTILK